jgi:serine phosphatase RsbU (regulator of sigma subunit)
VTFAAAKLSSDGTLEVYSAVHGPLVLRRTDGAVKLLDSHTFPLGITSELSGEEVTVRRLAPGDTLRMFSDGVTEIL